jgi:hypothetical protein
VARINSAFRVRHHTEYATVLGQDARNVGL